MINGQMEVKDSPSNVLVYEKLEDKIAYNVDVRVSYEDEPDSLYKDYSFTLYPSPRIPTTLQSKGNGTSNIMVATFDGDDNNEEFARTFNGEYEYVFGYADAMGYATYNRYYQYDKNELSVNDDITWVYTQWEIDDRLIPSKYRRLSGNDGDCVINTTRSTTSVNGVDTNELILSGNRFIASVSTPSSAVVSVMSMSGVVVRVFELAISTSFNEILDFNGLAPGVYVIRCNIGDQSMMQKIVIK